MRDFERWHLFGNRVYVAIDAHNSLKLKIKAAAFIVKNLNLDLYINDQLKQLLHYKEVFVFDWDGTILDSMKIKAVNFGQAFCSVLRHRKEQDLSDRVVRHYLRLSGYPRKRIFLQIMAIMGKEADQDSFERFNDVFEKLNKTSLIHARIFPDALALLEELIKRGCRIFISSSVPPQELADLVDATLPAQVKASITAILGSMGEHTKGQGHLRTIMQQTGATPDKLLVFGDDPADLELSSEAGVDCILVDRSGNLNLQEIRIVGSLIQIKDWLSK